MLAALLLGTCSDDEVGGSGGGSTPQPEAGKTAFGFALKDFAKGSVPLSKADGDKLPASVAESTIDSLAIYVFNQHTNNGRATSVFYVYPDMDKGDGSADDESATAANRFYLTLYGKTKKTGASVVYNVYMYKDNANQKKDPIIVKPNNQYLIKINDLDPTKQKATITVQDWLIGDTVNYEMSLGSVALSCVEFPLTEVTTGGSGQLLPLPTARANGNGRAVNVAVEAVSEWELAKGYNAAWIHVTEQPKLNEHAKSIKFDLLANDTTRTRTGTIRLYDRQDTTIYHDLVIIQAGIAATGTIEKESERSGDGFTDFVAQTGDVPQHYDYTLGFPVGKTTAAPYRSRLPPCRSSPSTTAISPATRSNSRQQRPPVARSPNRFSSSPTTTGQSLPSKTMPTVTRPPHRPPGSPSAMPKTPPVQLSLADRAARF